MRHAIIQRIREFDDENRIAFVVKDKKISYHKLISIHDAFHQFCMKQGISSDTYIGCHFKHDYYHLPIAQAILSDTCYVALNKIKAIDTLDYVITDDMNVDFIPSLIHSKIGIILYSITHNQFEIIHQFERKECMRDADWVTCAQTSGTTASAKVIVYSSSSYANKMINKSDLYNLNENTKLVNCVPFNRITTLGEFNRVTIKGGCLYLNNGFDIDFLIKMFRDETITHFAGSVAHLNQINQAINRFKQRKNTLVMIMGGSDFKRNDYIELIQILNAQLINHYGSKEVGTIASDKGEGLVPVVDIKIVNHEIWVKTDAAMDQYLNHENTEDVWFNTKDTGYLDEKGILHLTGRMSDWINLMGEKFSPISMEETIQNEFGIQHVLICDKDILNHKEVCVVLDHTSQLTLKEIRKVLIKKYDAYTCPTKLYRIENFSFTEEGKLDRKLIKENLNNINPIINENIQLNVNDEISQKIIQLIQAVLPNTPFMLDDNFIEIGGDSLKASELNTLILENYHFSLEPQYFFGQSNIQDMIDYIKSRKVESYCVKLNNVNNDKPPLFFIHDLSLDIISYHTIANLFNDRPVYGIRLLHNEFSQSEFTIEELSRIYINEIKRITDYPIYLVGLSIGGLIAYEMTCQNENVKYCLMIDTKKVKKDRNRNRIDYFIKGVKNGLYSLRNLGLKEKMTKVREKLLPFLDHTIKHNQNTKVDQNFRNAVKKYECKKTDKRIEYFVALDEKDTISYDYYKQFIPNIVRYEAPCLHSSFIKGSYRTQSIYWINQRLNEIEQEVEPHA